MTSIKMLGLLGLLGGLTLVATTDAPGHGCEPGKYGVLMIYDKKDAFGFVIRDGDRFVAVRVRKDARVPPRNFKKVVQFLELDDKLLGYDLRGKNKNVLVREKSGDDVRIVIDDASVSLAGGIVAAHASQSTITITSAGVAADLTFTAVDVTLPGVAFSGPVGVCINFTGKCANAFKVSVGTSASRRTGPRIRDGRLTRRT